MTLPAVPHAAPAPPPAAPACALQAGVALAGTPDPLRVAALLGWPLHEVRAGLAEPGVAAGAPPSAGGPVDRLAAVGPWYREDPAAAAQAVARAITLHLQQGRVEMAASIALGFGSAAQRLAVLAQSGWTLLWRPERALLGELLDSVATEPDAGQGVLLAVQLAWWVEVERVPHVADRRLQAGCPLPAAEQALFRSRIAQVFDDARGALSLAQEAVAGWANDLQPPALLAHYALGFALLDAGHPQAALAPLAAVLKGSARDGLPLLALDALAVQARVHDELADEAGVQATLAAARALAEGLVPAHPALRRLPALQALQRLQRGRALRRALDIAAAPLPALAEPAADDAYEAFPDRVIDALAALQAGALDDAGAGLAELRRRLALAFHCAKWRNAQLHAELWWLARRADAAALQARLQLAAAPAIPSVDEAATLVALHQAVLQAAGAALAGQAWPAERLQAWQDLIERRGLHGLRRRLLLVQAIGPPAQPEALLAWLTAVGEDGQVQDALWLAPKLAAVLEQLLASVAIVRHPAARALAQRLLQHLQAAPTAGPAEAEAAGRGPLPLPEGPPPADLTLREWQILQLIGQHYSNEQIAARLNVSVATVKTHINRVYGKLGIGSRAEAVQRAHHLG